MRGSSCCACSSHCHTCCPAREYLRAVHPTQPGTIAEACCDMPSRSCALLLAVQCPALPACWAAAPPSTQVLQAVTCTDKGKHYASTQSLQLCCAMLC